MKFPNIETQRLNAKMSKTALCEAIGVKPKVLAGWQNGTTEIRASKIVSLANLFGVTTDYLLGRTTNPKT
ncbi:MAG: helix-turn-helix domain-containing protein [Faecalibacterium sp.]